MRRLKLFVKHVILNHVKNLELFTNQLNSSKINIIKQIQISHMEDSWTDGQLTQNFVAA